MTAQMFGISQISLRKSLLRFLKSGVEGIKEKQRSGRKKKLNTAQEENFRVQVEKIQTERKRGRIHGQDIQVLLKEKFSVNHALLRVYHVLERYGLSWVSARSKHAEY